MKKCEYKKCTKEAKLECERTNGSATLRCNQHSLITFGVTGNERPIKKKTYSEPTMEELKLPIGMGGLSWKPF